MPEGSELLSRERYGYDGWGNTEEVRRQQESGGGWIVSRQEYDFRGRLLAEWTESGDGALEGPRKRYHYDAGGVRTSSGCR